MPKLAVVITCHNRRDKTLACLEALFANRLPEGVSLHVILVDDGSTDGTEAAVRERFPEVEILRGDGNLFWNRGMHRAFARAMEIGFDGYLWLNDDTMLYPSAIESMICTWKERCSDGGRACIVVGSTQDPDCGALTYGGVVANNRFRPFRFSLVSPQSCPVECHTMNGNCVFVPHEVVSVVGNLEPRFVHAMGDFDYGLRTRNAGFTLWVMPGYAGICARNLATGGFTDATLSLAQRLRQMNQPKGLPLDSWLLFARRHAGLIWPVYWLWPFIKVVTTSLLYRVRHVAGGERS